MKQHFKKDLNQSKQSQFTNRSILKTTSYLLIMPLITAIEWMTIKNVYSNETSVSCQGTFLQTNIREKDSIESKNLSYSLSLRQEGNSAEETLNKFNTSLDLIRDKLKAISLKELTVTPPTSFSYKKARSEQKVFTLNSIIKGEVANNNYKELIKQATIVDGVNIQSIKSIADPESEPAIKKSLLKKALKNGNKIADELRNELGLKDYKITSVNLNYNTSVGIRSYYMKASSAMKFNEIPKQVSSINLSLSYCLN